MRKTLLAAALLLPTLALGEIHAGTIEIQGSSSAGFNWSQAKEEGQPTFTSKSFLLGVSGLYYLTPLVGLGAEVDVTRSTIDLNNEFGGGTATGTRLLLAPKLALDFPLNATTSLFAEALVGLVRQSADSGAVSASATAFTWGVGGGVKLFPIPALSVDLGLRLRSLHADASDFGAKETDTDVSFMFGLSAYFGGH